MTKRWALASALLLTAIFSFFVVAYGTSAGIFAWSRGDGEAAPDVAFEQDAPTAVATVPANIVTEYVYVDEPAAPPVDEQQAFAQHDGDDDDDERYEDDHDEDRDDDDDEHEDEEEHHDDDDDDDDHDDDHDDDD